MQTNRLGSSGAVFESRYATSNRGRFHYLRWGSAGPTVVLVHATGFHAYVWKPLALALSRDCQVIAIDQRGHGDSPKPESGYAWENFGDDLCGILQELGTTHVVGVGHSAGASAIAIAAAKQPPLFRGIVLIDPVLYPRATVTAENPLALRARKRRMVWESRTEIFSSFRAREPFRSWREDALWAYIEEGTTPQAGGQIRLKCPAEIEAQIYEMAPLLDGFAILERLTIPVLLLRGEHSDTFATATAQRALATLKQGELKTVANTSHFVPMERPEAVERAIRKFMEKRLR